MMKRLLSLAAFALALSLVGAVMFTPNVQTASAANNAVDQFANVELPPDLGQASIQVFVPETGHTLRGYFLDYWRANGGQAVYGDPISEPFASADGLYSQAFEKGVFQFRLDLVWTEDPSVTLMNLGDHTLNDRLDTYRTDAGAVAVAVATAALPHGRASLPMARPQPRQSQMVVSGTKPPATPFRVPSMAGTRRTKDPITWGTQSASPFTTAVCWCSTSMAAS